MSKLLRFDCLFDGEQWFRPAFIRLDDAGCVHSISTNKSDAEVIDQDFDGIAIPGFVNAHSHAFQFAMAGMTENVAQGFSSDDFWSWREKMYRLANSLSPDEIADVSRACFRQMLRNGYTSVCEFHYIHHQQDGLEYEDRGLIARAIISAAQDVGIDITMVPVLYQTGDVGQPPSDRQKRFIFSDADRFLGMVDDLRRDYRSTPGVAIGVAAHSLRAVPEGALKELVDYSSEKELQFHIHISEQMREVESVKKAYGQTPIHWFMDRFEGNSRFNLVHATHADPTELVRLVQAGVNIVLCPSTEGDLGDGLFPFADFHRRDGRWSIGSDSNLVLDPWCEIRMIDFAERMRQRRRDILCAEGEEAGEKVFHRLQLSSQKIRADLGSGLSVGRRLDLLILRAEHHSLAGVPETHLASAILYSGNPGLIKARLRSGVGYSVDELTAAEIQDCAVLARIRRRLWG